MQRIAGLLSEGEDHVHAGRHALAEACVAEVLAREPHNAQAHYVAGLSLLFRKRAAEALECFRRALESEPARAQFHFVSGMALGELGRSDEAVAAYRRAIELRPAFFEALANEGNLLQKAHRRPEAIDAYRRALALRPGEAVVLAALGTCELAEGHAAAAVVSLERAVALRPDYATAYNALGNALGQTGNVGRAIEMLRRATELRPDFIEAWANLGEQLHVARQDAAAIEAFDRALVLDPSNDETRFRRDATIGAAVERAPDRFVKNVFDRYADDFDERLTRDLGYRTPEDLAAFIEPWLATRDRVRVVDLGCGTGLSGIRLRAKAAHLAGVDLSAKMLERAARRGIYDELAEAEVVAFLEGTAPGSFDLAVALDVLVYIGNIVPLFAACSSALRPGGVFALSTEHLDDGAGEFRLARTGRYAHAERYVLQSATAAGMQPLREQAVVIRKEAGQPVDGRLYAFVKPA